MENASKALIMAGGVLIGILVLSLAVYLFANFGATAANIHSQIEEQQVVEFNAQFTKYQQNATIYDIITLNNLAKQNNENYNDDSNYSITISIDNSQLNGSEKELIESNTNNGNLTYFECKTIKYHTNGRVKSMNFTKNR